MSAFSRLFPMPRHLPPLQPQIEAWTNRDALEQVVLDVTGFGPGLIGRSAAMRVPAVARGRHLTAGTLAGLPLRAMRGAEEIPAKEQPYWMYGTDGQLGDLTAEQCAKWGISPQSPWQRALWTADDHMFYGDSLWIATQLQGGSTDRPRPLRMLRVPWDCWEYEAGVFLDSDMDPLPADRIVYIPGPHEGLLNFGQTTITQAASLESTAADVAAHPIRFELHQTTDATLSAADRGALVDEARAALAAHDGILFTNNAVETIEHRMDNANDLVIAGRNAAAVDIARHISMPAAMLDASTEGSSLEYQTLEGRNQQWLDYGLSLYLTAIESRLSMDDVLPAGQRAAFDTADLTSASPSPTGPVTED